MSVKPIDGMRRVTIEAGRAETDPARHARRRRTIEVGLGIAVPIALLGLWQAASVNGWIDRIFYPAPTDVVAYMRDRAFSNSPGGHMWGDVGYSVKRVLYGYLWGAVAGVAAGVVMGMNRWIRSALQPMLNALYTVPKIALIGVFLVIFGFRDKPVIAIVAVTVFFVVWIASMEAVRTVSENFLEASRSFGSSRWQSFRHVVLPAALPQMFVGLNIAAGIAVLSLIGVEFAYPPHNQGIGFRINNARTIGQYKEAYVGLLIAALLGVVFSAVVRLVGRLLTPWVTRDDSSR